MTIQSDAVQADMAVSDEIVRRIVSRFQPQRIILFGSRARGDADPDSDYDLLIADPETKRMGQEYAGPSVPHFSR